MVSQNACTAVESPCTTLPTDLLLEIAARTDPSTLVRCAAASKLLRRDILSQSYIRRVTDRQHGIMPGRLLAYIIHTRKGQRSPPPPPLYLVNPSTPAAGSFLEHHMSPFMSRNAADLLAEYQPVTSRGGLVLLHRRHGINRCGRPDCLCVYDPMTGDRTFLSGPPRMTKTCLFLGFVMLNAKDGIGCAFKLFAVNVDYHQLNGCKVRVQAITSSKTSWAPVAYDGYIDLPTLAIQDRRCTFLLRGGGIHLYWLDRYNHEILTYDVHADRLDKIKLPFTDSNASQRRLQTLSDGRMRLLTADGFVISVWLLQLQGTGWTQEAMIDTKENLQLLDPMNPLSHVEIKFEDFIRGERSNVVILHICAGGGNYMFDELIILDLETREMRRMPRQDLVSSMLLEIDLLSRLKAMKTFS